MTPEEGLMNGQSETFRPDIRSVTAEGPKGNLGKLVPGGKKSSSEHVGQTSHSDHLHSFRSKSTKEHQKKESFLHKGKKRRSRGLTKNRDKCCRGGFDRKCRYILDELKVITLMG